MAEFINILGFLVLSFIGVPLALIIAELLLKVAWFTWCVAVALVSFPFVVIFQSFQKG